MPDLTITISERALSNVEALADQETDAPCIAKPSVEEMAGSLLEAYLILIRDCGHILPSKPFRSQRHPGVSLGNGIGKMPRHTPKGDA